MNIVVLDGGTTNPGDLSWEPLERLGNLTVYHETPSKLVLERLRNAQAVILNRNVLGREEFSQLPQLRYVGTLATGYNTIDTQAAREFGITVCNVPHYCEASVAQHALALLLCLCNKVQRSSDLTRAGHWTQAVEESHQSLLPVELAGKTLGLVGFGSTGQRMAQLGLALGMEVLLYSRTQKPAPEGCRWVDLETLFKKSDVVSLHCPLTEETRGLVSRGHLAMMKPTAFLINTARGAVVDEAALAQALNEGRLAGAGVDVFTQEPPAPDHPLLGAKNCVLTPHVAWATREARERLIETVADNLQRYMEGKPQNVVS
ncbi:4-phosphoerythronate dehydrogenase [Clostridium sp. CAG:1013]|mgnify:CR=1 FL=1|nr:4-phosphoerythronate dehydrogenase [Clostridium sp. CAG:1013]